MKCECCGEREADQVLGVGSRLVELVVEGYDIFVPLYADACWAETLAASEDHEAARQAFMARIRARRAADEILVAATPRYFLWTPPGVSISLGNPPPVPVDPYAEHRLATDGYSRAAFDARDENLAAERRMAAWDRKERPRMTKDRRELAKPHPWTTDDSDP